MKPKTEVTGFEWLEKLLNQRLNEILDSMHRSDLKGQVSVKLSHVIPEEKADNNKCLTCGHYKFVHIDSKGPCRANFPRPCLCEKFQRV